MEKNAKNYNDPNMKALIQNKSNWNKEVSTFINDVIHLKKTMNGWPSKYHPERSSIMAPIPADPTTIISTLAAAFQEIATKGTSIVQEQVNFIKIRNKKKSDKTLNKLDQMRGPENAAPAPAEPAKVDLTKELSQTASLDSNIVKLADNLESKHYLEVTGSNPLSRFVTRLTTPTIGFGEKARIRSLRMTMLSNCVLTLKSLKKLRNEIIGSSKSNIINGHKMMTSAWNHWAIVPSNFMNSRVTKDVETIPTNNSGDGLATPAANPDVEDRNVDIPITSPVSTQPIKPRKIKDTKTIDTAYPTTPTVISDPLVTEAQLKRWIGKARHQILPGATSSSRLQIYRTINDIIKDLNSVMDLLQKGFDEEKLSQAISTVNRQMSSLRIMVRKLYFSEKPEEAPPMQFF